MNQKIRQLAEGRLSRADVTFKEGELLLKKNFLGGAINRFYYAAFYAAKALLALKGLEATKHSGTISLFHLHFVKPGLVDHKIAGALSRSFEERQDNDYGDFAQPIAKDVVLLKQQVSAFLEARRQAAMG